MRVAHLADLGFRKGRPWRRRRHHVIHHGGGWGPWWGGYVPGYVEPPQPKFVLIDPNGKPVMVITGLPANLKPGYTLRPATPAEAATGIPNP